MKEYLTYKLENPDPVSDGLFYWLSTIMGISIRESKRGNADIYYGNSGSGKKLTIKKNENDVIWHDLIKGNKEKLINNNINFDIINALSLFLSDEVNSARAQNAFDTHGRLKYNFSYQFENNAGEIPIVNLYVNFLKDLFFSLTKKKSASFFPQGKTCAICLSHDVDKPMLFQFLRDFGFNKNWLFKEKFFHLSRYIYNGGKYIFSSGKKRMSKFEIIVVEEKRRGFKSTFYFASNNGYSDWGSVHDTFYNIEWPEFKPVFRTMKENNFNIGLHAGYNSYLSTERLQEEKEKLEKISGINVIGLRHHYWHLGNDINETLNKHHEAGFKYDSSTGFNDHAGFRRNCAIPYYPVDKNEKKLIKCLQIPVFCMDGNLLYKNNSVKKALTTLKKYIEIIKQHNGIASLNWHSETSFPQNGKYKNWAVVYLQILDYLSKDTSIWVTSPDEVYNHFSSREKEIHKETS